MRTSISERSTQSEDSTIHFVLGNPAHINHAMDALRESASLQDQVDLLHYISSCRGHNYTVDLKEMGKGTVRELLDEVYQKAAQRRQWSVVRLAAGLLRKVVNSLTINLTDLLIRQKQVTVGFGEKEFTIDTPLSPDVLADAIYTHWYALFWWSHIFILT